jgi:hypothetical protein
MTEPPPARGRRWPAAALAFASGLGIAALVALVGQLVGLALYLAQGANGPFGPYARLGAAYVELFHHVVVALRVDAAGGSPWSVDLGIALLLVTAGAIVGVGLAGRRLVADAAGMRPVAVVGALAAGYAVVPFLAAFVAHGSVAVPATLAFVGRVLSVGVSGAQAFALAFAIAAGAGAVGALSAGSRSPTRADATVADVVLGAARALALALLLSVVGLLVLASVQPSLARAYGSVIAAPDSAAGRAVLAGHAVLLAPNQAVWVLVPAMGACDEVVVNGTATPFLCYWRSPTELPSGVAVDAGAPAASPSSAASPTFRALPRAYLAFLLVPLLSTIGGGIRAARHGDSIGSRLLAGAASGIVFAAFVAVAIALSRVDLAASGAVLGRTALRLSVGPELVRGTALAAAWGIGGGALGGALSRYVGGTGTITE